MMMKKVMIIHLHHQCNSREEVGEIQFLPPNIFHQISSTSICVDD
jgi:hypothetical protein